MSMHHIPRRAAIAPFVVGLLAAVLLAVPGCRKKVQPKPPEAPTAPPSFLPGGEGNGTDSGGDSGTRAPQGSGGAAAPTPPATSMETSTADSPPTVLMAGGIEGPKPATWVWRQPTMAFRTLQYAVPGADGADAADFIVSVFPRGDGGPIDMNLQRWINQFRDADNQPIDAAPTVETVAGMTVHLVDLEGRYQGMGMAAPRPGQAQLGAIVEGPVANVFLRLLGPVETVNANRDAWNELILGLRPVSTDG